MKKIGSVNEEYMDAFRTKSYAEILDKMRASTSACSLSEQVLEPPPSTADDVSGSPRVAEALLVEYFQASGKACDFCEVLLRGVHLLRENIPETLPRNPFSAVNFRGRLYDELKVLFRKIRTERRKNKRKARLIRLRKVVAGGGLVLTSTVAAAAAMLVPALHGVAGLLAFAAAPGLAGLSWEAERKDKTTSLRKRSDRLALAGKGVYILIKDLDSLGRLAQRVRDRVDHSRAVADLCLRNGRSGEMAKELLSPHSLQAGFLELLDELDHVFLCIVNINRFRKLLIPKILLPSGDETSSTRT